MSRTLKQFLYGVFYLAVLGGICFGFYSTFLKPVPSCFDGVQNQGETGVDCGGPCSALCTATLAPVQSIGIPATFPGVAGGETFLGQIENPNTDFGVQVLAYHFDLLDNAGSVLRSIPGETFIYPNQTKYVAAVNEQVPQGTASVNLVVASDTAWTPSGVMGPLPQFTFQNLATQVDASGTVAVSGQIVNPGSISATKVIVIAIFKTSTRTPLEISQTVIDAVPVGSPTNFSISAPAIQNIDPTATQMVAYSSN